MLTPAATIPQGPVTPRRAGFHALFVCLLCGIGGGVTGCASYRAMPFLDSGAASTHVEHKERDGLHVAIRSLADTRTSVNHFSHDLTAYGFVPVLIFLELSNDANGVFQIQRDAIQLCLRDGTRLHPVDPAEVVDAVSFSHWRTFFGFFPLLLPGFFVASSVNNANSDLEMDYRQKSLRSVRISPNMRVYDGAVFFEMPDAIRDEFTITDAFVEIITHKEGTKNRTAQELGKELEFAVHFSE